MDMDSTLRIDNLFNVDGLVAVITGGGTGWQSFVDTKLQEAGISLRSRLYFVVTTRYRENDDDGTRRERRAQGIHHREARGAIEGAGGQIPWVCTVLVFH